MMNTKTIGEAITNFLNTDPQAQAITEAAAAAAVEKGLTPEEWQAWKESFFGAIFYKMALEHEDVREAVTNEIGPKIYEELRKG
ncbi:MAG: hypothetical protein HDQ97_09155 [Lachnospiraceae bacterium]|nr:hypothetical protein [Lachnospiraceae bacterium]